MIFPERTDAWRNKAKPAQEVFSEIAAAIGKYEPLTMLVSAKRSDYARQILPSYIRIIEISSDDAWARDTGATFVKNDKGILRGIDWKFNAWGGNIDGLYFPWDKDEKIAKKMCELEKADRYRLDDFILEGGSIHTDGQGTLLTTKACLLSKGRNPHLSKEQIELKLKQYLNIQKIIWLERGIYLDETNEHIDNICCFVKPACAALAWTDDKSDPQYELSKSAYDILSNTKDAKGRDIEIHKIHLPKPQFITQEEAKGIDCVKGTYQRKAGMRLAASYINYFVCNGAVIMPSFKDPNDAKAKESLAKLYPDRDIIQIYSREILLGGGNIHCITQQVPQK